MREARRSRSYKRTQKQLARAVERRANLLEKGKLSLPSGEGILAIIVSRGTTFPSAFDPEVVRQEYQARMREAVRLREAQKDQHRGGAIIRPRARVRSIRLDLADPEITDIIFMGHGTINSLITDDDGRYFSWYDASRATSHLKQGVVEQRMCGNLPEGINYSVPLGTFIVSDIMNIRAAVGRGVPLPDGSSRNHLFQPVFDSPEHVLGQIAALNETYYAGNMVPHAA